MYTSFQEFPKMLKADYVKRAIITEMKKNGKESAILLFPEASSLNPLQTIDEMTQERFEEIIKTIGGFSIKSSEGKTLNDIVNGYDVVIPNY